MAAVMPARVLLLAPAPPLGLVEDADGGVPGVEVLRLPEHSVTALHDLLPTADVVIGDWSGRLRLGTAEAQLAVQPNGCTG